MRGRPPTSGAAGSIVPGASPSRNSSRCQFSERGSAIAQAALNGAKPGDRLLLAGGTYGGAYTHAQSGKPGQPIVIGPAAGATVTFTGTFSMPGQRPRCAAKCA